MPRLPPKPKTSPPPPATSGGRAHTRTHCIIMAASTNFPLLRKPRTHETTCLRMRLGNALRRASVGYDNPSQGSPNLSSRSSPSADRASSRKRPDRTHGRRSSAALAVVASLHLTLTALARRPGCARARYASPSFDLVLQRCEAWRARTARGVVLPTTTDRSRPPEHRRYMVGFRPSVGHLAMSSLRCALGEHGPSCPSPKRPMPSELSHTSMPSFPTPSAQWGRLWTPTFRHADDMSQIT